MQTTPVDGRSRASGLRPGVYAGWVDRWIGHRLSSPVYGAPVGADGIMHAIEGMRQEAPERA